MLERSRHPALVEHHDPIAKMNQFRRVRAEQNHGFALRRHRAQRKVDFALGFDVNTPSRIVQKQDRRLERQPFRQGDLLLVSAGEGLSRPAPIASDIEALREPFREYGFLRSSATLETAAGEQWQEQIEVDRVWKKQAFLASIRGDVGDAGLVGLRHRCEGRAPHGSSLGEYAELFRLGADGAVKAHHEVFLTMPDKAADPEDLSARELEIDVNRPCGAEAFRLKNEIACRM